ncbi:MFS transporter [Ulvibacter antarcticus]|uniref:Uncharacterized protein n=1 Tax=Ulvibacter antarcticus TaxID=442714 RepID=A0A3L9Y8Z1_9FLAO|nr:hypothetical protein [Ulvibacter antarcticus]RMA57161.1 hypothetical protein BXY75_3048 [Ulvibacter antarcticus]
MTLEITVFILAILFGIIFYWSEAKSNRLYRFFNKLTHSKELQMKPENKKGFIHKQPFLLRLVWVTLLFVLAGVIVSVATPINAFYVQYFVTAIAGTLIGSYIASVFLFARDSTKKENLEKAFKKGKDFVEDVSEDIRENFEAENKEVENTIPEPEAEPKKSARDRLKDKGMIK